MRQKLSFETKLPPEGIPALLERAVDLIQRAKSQADRERQDEDHEVIDLLRELSGGQIPSTKDSSAETDIHTSRNNQGTSLSRQSNLSQPNTSRANEADTALQADTGKDHDVISERCDIREIESPDSKLNQNKQPCGSAKSPVEVAKAKLKTFATQAQRLDDSWNNFQNESFPSIDSLLASAKNVEIRNDGIGPVSIAGVASVCSQVVRTRDVPTITLLGAGSFNIVLLVKFPDSGEVVARIPMRDTWQPGLIESQVATMAYAHSVLGVPVPQVYAWNEDFGNPVQAPYMVMEYVHGESLHKVWSSFSADGKASMLGDLAQIHASLSRPLPFSIGSLRFSEQVKQETHQNLADDKAYTVGPLFRPQSPFSDIASQTRWPTHSVTDIFELWKGIYEAELEAMSARWGGKNDLDLIADSDGTFVKRLRMDFSTTFRHSKEAADAVRKMITRCPPLADGRSCLVHIDWAFRNVHVRVHKHYPEIVSILDWDGATILPFELLPQYPQDFCSSTCNLGQMTSAEVFLSLPPKYRNPMITMSPGELATDFDITMIYMTEELVAREQRVYKDLYVRCLEGWDKRLRPMKWTHGSYPKVVHYFVTGGFTEWCRRRAVLEKEKEQE